MKGAQNVNPRHLNDTVVFSAELAHSLQVWDRPRNTPKRVQNRSESLCAGWWAPCRVFGTGFGPALGSNPARNRRFPAGSLKRCEALRSSAEYSLRGRFGSRSSHLLPHARPQSESSAFNEASHVDLEIGYRCSSPSPGTMRIITNSKIAQTLCPEALWGPILLDKSVKNVWGRRPHTCFTLVLRNLGPQTCSRHHFCVSSIHI